MAPDPVEGGTRGNTPPRACPVTLGFHQCPGGPVCDHTPLWPRSAAPNRLLQGLAIPRRVFHFAAMPLDSDVLISIPLSILMERHLFMKMHHLT